jgi:hypothetical protein
MNESRSSYVKVLPLVFLVALLVVGLQIYRDSQYTTDKPADQLLPYDWFISIIKHATIWMAIGYAFRQMKAAAIALGTTVLMLVADHFLYKNEVFSTSYILNSLYPLLFNVSFLPALVFGLICFKKQSLRYFLPVWLCSQAITIIFIGSCYLDASPYNSWYRFLRIEELFWVRTGSHSYRALSILSYTFDIASMTGMFVMTGECYAAATAHKKWKGVFHIDLTNNYTKAGAISLFFALRLLINLLVIGFFTYHFAHFSESGRIYFRNQSLFTFILTTICGLALLAAIVLYYRRFMVEYFIASRQKIQWLFWIVNMPVIGMLVFPFVVLSANNKPEDRTRFFFNNAMYNRQPYVIMIVMLLISLIGTIFGRSMDRHNDFYWLLWLVEAALFIWYVASLTGYYVFLGFGVLGLIIFSSQAAIEAQTLSRMRDTYNAVYGSRSVSRFIDHSINLWLITAFQVVQYVVLLPMFHLDKLKIIQREETVTGYTLQDTGVPNLNISEL